MLDDAHLVPNREIVKSLPAVLKRLPGAFAVLVLSRDELPEDCETRRRDPAVLVGIDLRFTADEVRGYFKASAGSSRPTRRGAFAATEGWAIGVAAVAKTTKSTPATAARCSLASSSRRCGTRGT